MSYNNWNCIVAADLDNGIGKNNSIPWHVQEDLKNFKQLTSGGVVVMGRKTYESIGEPLPNRVNIVLSKKETNIYDKIHGFNKTKNYPMTPEELLEHFNRLYSDKQVWIIGGSQIYELLLPYCNKIYITQIHSKFDCDVSFPSLNLSNEWKEEVLSEVLLSPKQGLNYQYFLYTRSNNND